MILVDSSVWIEYFRGTEHPSVGKLQKLLATDDSVVITEPVIMELLAGADTPQREEAISRLTNGLALLPVDAAVDYRAAAAISVASRKIGRPVRSLNDCLIAAIALRTGAKLLHKDRDFESIASVTALQTA